MDRDSSHSSDDSVIEITDSREAMDIDQGDGAPEQHAYLNPFEDDALSMYLYSDEVQESAENRERRHAAASVLGDPELLMFHAIANNESIPQTRERFHHHLLGIPPPATRKEIIRDLSNPFRPRLPDFSAPYPYTEIDRAIFPTAPFVVSTPQKRKQFEDTAPQRPLASRTFSASHKNIIPIADVMEVNGKWDESWHPSPALAAAAAGSRPSQQGNRGSGSERKASRQSGGSMASSGPSLVR